jgi:hypothetical protein
MCDPCVYGLTKGQALQVTAFSRNHVEDNHNGHSAADAATKELNTKELNGLKELTELNEEQHFCERTRNLREIARCEVCSRCHGSEGEFVDSR